MNPQSILERIDALPYSDKERTYLGASEIGNECDRALWLKFNQWAEPEQFPARMHRLFQRGHEEEWRFKKLLEDIGAELVVAETGVCDQHAFSDGYFRGHADDVWIMHGQRITAEYKTHNDKSFKMLKHGMLKQIKPMHYAQAIVYAGYLNTEGTLYVAVNKNDDELFIDWIPFNQGEFDEYRAKARRIVTAEKPPGRVCNSATDYRGKFCHMRDVCFGMANPRVVCRTCTSRNSDADSGHDSCDVHVDMHPCEMHSFNPYGMLSMYGWEPIEFFPKSRSVKYAHGLVNGSAGVASTEVEI